jgi:hypothetical protein
MPYTSARPHPYCALADGSPTFAAFTNVLAGVSFFLPDLRLGCDCPHYFHLCTSPLTLFSLGCITHVHVSLLILTCSHVASTHANHRTLCCARYPSCSSNISCLLSLFPDVAYGVIGIVMVFLLSYSKRSQYYYTRLPVHQ